MAENGNKIVHLDQKYIPEAWYNVLPDLPRPLDPPLHPVTHQPIGPDDLAPLFPMGLIMQEMSADNYIEIRQGGPGDLQDMEAHPPGAGHPPGEGPQDPGQDLLQERGLEPGRQPQGQHRGGPGLLQQAGGREAHLHRDRGGPVGNGPLHGLQVLRHGPGGLHGALQLQPEALPAHPHGDLGRRSTPQPQPAHRGRHQDPGAGPPHAGKPGHGHLRGGIPDSRRPRRQVLPGQRAQPRAAAPDGHRPGGQDGLRVHRRLPRHRHRLLRRRLQPGRRGPALPQGTHGGQGHPPGRGGASLLPHPHRGPLQVRLRRLDRHGPRA